MTRIDLMFFSHNYIKKRSFTVYNPQNEMFSHFGTKRYNFKNETQLFKVIPHTSKNQKKIDRLRRNEIHLKAVRTSS